MRLVEALEILRTPPPPGAAPFRVALACGFTPLHLRTFLEAELRQALPDLSIEFDVGLFDDVVGNVARAAGFQPDVIVTVIEWPDVDPRLGLRRLGGWRVADVVDAVPTAERQLARLGGALARAAEAARVVCSLPTLPLPPAFHQGPDEAGAQELALRAPVVALAASLSASPSIRIASAQRLDLLSPPAERHDAKSELGSGFPYTLEHASALASVLARLAVDRPPKKGLITDLDDTLWDGIVGEVGAASVSWSDDAHSHHHALYQQFLASLASAGVLIGVASKNEPASVDEVFERDDILLSREAVFPFEVHWDSKSASVERILQAWNVAPDAVVFVDDSPAEIAQVQSVFPDLEGIVFPGRDPRALMEFFAYLRELFGKHVTGEVDRLRVDSLRRSARFHEASSATQPESLDDFLREIRGVVHIVSGRRPDERALELIAKTNQFNLNGRRLTAADFGRMVGGPRGFLVTAAYEDRFGPLGKIAALLGRTENGRIVVDSWVMSCRAFSRRIEHHCLAYLFDTFGADEIVLAYTPTDRNAPLRQFLQSLLGDVPEGSVRVTREAFQERAPALVHRVEVEHG